MKYYSYSIDNPYNRCYYMNMKHYSYSKGEQHELFDISKTTVYHTRF